MWAHMNINNQVDIWLHNFFHGSLLQASVASSDGKRQKKIERKNQKSFVVGRVVESTILFQERIWDNLKLWWWYLPDLDVYTAQIAFNISYSLCNALYPCFEVNNSIDVLSMTMREALEFSMYTANTPQKMLQIILQILLINLFIFCSPNLSPKYNL